MDEMKILLDSANCIDVFGMCETFLTETTENDTLSISGYNIERKDRCETISTTNNGGGILIYLNSHLNYIRRKDIECNEIESVWVEIRWCNNKPFLLCSVLDHHHQMLLGASISLSKLKRQVLIRVKFTCLVI